MSDRNENGVIFTFLLGIAAGAAATVFLKSEKGKEFAGQIKNWAEDNMDLGLERLEELKEDVEKEIKKKKKTLDKKVQKMKEDILEEEN